jgi:hypothetical protein
MRAVLVAMIAGGLALSSYGEPGQVFRVDFSNPGLTPAQWTLEIHPDGSGHFRSIRGSAVPDGPPTLEAPNVDRDVHLSAKFALHAFQVTQRHKLFARGCESHLKVAFQGLKKLSYSGPDGQGGCEFNYSKDAEIQALGDSMVAVATTIIEGARLELLLQHDRLGLDKEIGIVEEAAGDGRVQEICSIREILERLSQDPAVMERVRKRARDLLARANN